jgi:hypothetical protein
MLRAAFANLGFCDAPRVSVERRVAHDRSLEIAKFLTPSFELAVQAFIWHRAAAERRRSQSRLRALYQISFYQ